MSPGKYAHLGTAACTALCLLVLAAAGAVGSPLADREVTAMFRSGIVSPPGGAVAFEATTTSVLSAAVYGVLSSYGVEAITKAFPYLTDADTLMVNRAGETMAIPQYSEVYRLRLPSGANTASLASTLDQMDGVIFAEPCVTASLTSAPIYPNDSLFVDGTEWSPWNRGQSGGSPDADVQGPEAWGTTTGSDSVTIAIIDDRFDPTHPEFAGRVLTALSDNYTDYPPDTDHGFEVAGVAAATGNNHIGIAGMDWRCNLVSLDAQGDTTYIASQIVRAVFQAKADVINNSYAIHVRGLDTNALIVHSAVVTAANYGAVVTAAMDNANAYHVVWPAGYSREVIAVGATDRFDHRWVDSGGRGSNMGLHIDVVAPGADMVLCQRTGAYILDSGTSFATPVVSGIAALLRSRDHDLCQDDVRELIRASATDLGPAGFDSAFGFGRVNASRALKLLDAPNIFEKGGPVYNQNQDFASTARYQARIVSTPHFSGTWWAERHEVRRAISFTKPFTMPPRVWGRGIFTSGTTTDTTNFGLGWCEVVPGTLTSSGCTLRAYVYALYNSSSGGPLYDWFPLSPGSVRFAWSALQIAPIPDVSQSFYVPQAGSTTAPLEGLSTPNPSYRFFRACPNNDGGASLPNNARVKVVVKDAAGNGIAGIQPSDIFVWLNGGTPAQAFLGDGADSVISDSLFNHAPLCPVLRAIEADTTTNAVGETYITFAGRPSGGIATRDPGRKWGHYDSELPVYVLGQKLMGRLTSGSSNGSYNLRIKNFDWTGGLGAVMNQGETVTTADFNGVANNIGVDNTISYWKDFDSTCLLGEPNCTGGVNTIDFTIISAHVGHNCTTPHSP